MSRISVPARFAGRNFTLRQNTCGRSKGHPRWYAHTLVISSHLTRREEHYHTEKGRLMKRNKLTNSELAELMIRYRAQKRLSQDNFAKELKMSHTTIWKLETERTPNIRPTTYLRIVDYIRTHE